MQIVLCMFVPIANKYRVLQGRARSCWLECISMPRDSQRFLSWRAKTQGVADLAKPFAVYSPPDFANRFYHCNHGSFLVPKDFGWGYLWNRKVLTCCPHARRPQTKVHRRWFQQGEGGEGAADCDMCMHGSCRQVVTWRNYTYMHVCRFFGLQVWKSVAPFLLPEAAR